MQKIIEHSITMIEMYFLYDVKNNIMIFDDRKLYLVQEILKVYSFQLTDKDLYRSIYEKYNAYRNVALAQGVDVSHIDNRFNFGGLSILESSTYVATNTDGGILMTDYEMVVQSLVKNGLLQKEDVLFSLLDKQTPNDYRFRITNFGFLLFLKGLAVNTVFGFPFILERYKNAIPVVTGKLKNGDIGVGTAFVIQHNNRKVIVTCKHNVEMSGLDFLYNGISLKHKTIKYHLRNRDIVLVEFENQELVQEAFYISPAYSVLEEIISMGYPVIPTTSDVFLTVHKGEINAEAASYLDHEKYIIFSAKTSSGNSGSPLINLHGEVIGIVTNEFFDQNAFKEKGKPPYFAAIPIKELESF